MNIKGICETGPTVYRPYPRRHRLLSYFKILSVDPAGVRTCDLPHDSPMSHRFEPSVHGDLSAQLQYNGELYSNMF